MTLTLIVRNPYTRQIGAAIASGSDDCMGGSFYTRKDVGLVSVQAKGSAGIGEAILQQLAEGMASADILENLRLRDSQLDLRQILIVPFDGDIVARTGAHCVQWAGHILKEHYVLAGNMLVSGSILSAMEKAYMVDMQDLMRTRLMNALRAGVAAGGDVRGHKSAGFMIMGHQPFSLKVVGTEDPVQTLTERLRAAA